MTAKMANGTRPNPIVRIATRRRRPDAPRRSSAPPTMMAAPRIKPTVGIQNENRIATGLSASPATDPDPTSVLAATVLLCICGAYGRLPPLRPVGTMLA